MSLESSIASLVNASTELTQTVRGKTAEIDSKVSAKLSELDAWRKGVRAEHPVAPNVFRDTKYFKGFCGGQVKVPMNLGTAGAIGGAWNAGWNLADGEKVSAIVTFEVIPFFDPRLDALGFGNRDGVTRKTRADALISETGYGADFNVLVITVDVSSVTGKPSLIIGQDNSSFTSWAVGGFDVTSCAAGAAILTGGAGAPVWGGNRAPAVPFNGRDWSYRIEVQRGFGGTGHCVHMPFSAPGVAKFALALPYSGTGNHGDIPVWAGAIGASSGYPYTHADVIGA